MAIVSKNWAQSGLLPKEDILGEELGVSRTVVREAIKSLSSKTVVETRRRRGTAILDKSNWNFVDRELIHWMSDSNLFPGIFEQLFEALAYTQPELLSNVARVEKDSSPLGSLAEAIQGSPHETAAAALDFHLAVAQLAANPFLLTLTSNVIRSLRNQHLERLVDIQFGSRQQNYLALTDAISGNDPEFAKQQMSTIFRQFVTFAG